MGIVDSPPVDLEPAHASIMVPILPMTKPPTHGGGCPSCVPRASAVPHSPPEHRQDTGRRTHPAHHKGERIKWHLGCLLRVGRREQGEQGLFLWCVIARSAMNGLCPRLSGGED